MASKAKEHPRICFTRKKMPMIIMKEEGEQDCIRKDKGTTVEGRKEILLYFFIPEVWSADMAEAGQLVRLKGKNAENDVT